MLFDLRCRIKNSLRPEAARNNFMNREKLSKIVHMQPSQSVAPRFCKKCAQMLPAQRTIILMKT
jgi:RNase P subunit RPR2